MIAPEHKASVQKAGAFALLGVSALVVALLVVVPLTQVTIDARDEVAAARERLATLIAKRADLTALETALKLETTRNTDKPLLFEAPTSAAGWERMETQLRSIALGRGAQVSSVRPGRLEDDGSLKALRLEVAMRVPRERLTDLIAAIEAATPMLFVERFRIADDGRSGRGADDQLDASFSVRALAAIGSPALAERQKTVRQ